MKSNTEELMQALLSKVVEIAEILNEIHPVEDNELGIILLDKSDKYYKILNLLRDIKPGGPVYE